LTDQFKDEQKFSNSEKKRKSRKQSKRESQVSEFRNVLSMRNDKSDAKKQELKVIRELSMMEAITNIGNRINSDNLGGYKKEVKKMKEKIERLKTHNYDFENKHADSFKSDSDIDDAQDLVTSEISGGSKDNLKRTKSPRTNDDAKSYKKKASLVNNDDISRLAQIDSKSTHNVQLNGNESLKNDLFASDKSKGRRSSINSGNFLMSEKSIQGAENKKYPLESKRSFNKFGAKN
jgi:hypothetical protein